MSVPKFKKGDIVAYRTKDMHGYQYIFGKVDEVKENGYVGLRTLPETTGAVALLIKERALTKVKTVWGDSLRNVQDFLPTDEEHPHYTCLHSMSVVLNRYQDIEDVLGDDSMTAKQKLKRIKKINGEIGKVTSKYLPG